MFRPSFPQDKVEHVQVMTKPMWNGYLLPAGGLLVVPGVIRE